MSGELACRKENTQHARGCGLREGKYSTYPGMRPAGRRILNIPGIAARGKENTQHARGFGLEEVKNITAKKLWEPMT